jgi:hypothetical protein
VALPGPLELGRAVIVGAGADAPAAWAGTDRVAVDPDALRDVAPLVRRLHAAWSDREPIVIELGLDPATFRAPLS